MIRLGLALDQIIFDDNGRYSTDEAFVEFVRLATVPAFDRIQFCSRVQVGHEARPYDLDPSVFEIVPLPWYTDIQAFCLKSPVLIPRVARRLADVMPGWDLALASGVHPLTPLVLRMARRRDIPTLLWIRGNLDADLSFRFSGSRRVAARMIARLLIRLIPGNTPVVSVGRDDYPFLARQGPVHVVFSSKFSEQDFRHLPRPSPHDDPTPRLLYVGRISPEKGLENLLEAIRLLGKVRGCFPSLTIVGDDHHGSSYGDTFRRLVKEGTFPGGVRLVGHVPYGPRLFEWYDTHDLLVLPSYTEGFPQVILEALARGVPVVSTNVGGIPRLIEDGINGLLVPPGHAGALADAMRKLLQDKDFSQTLAKNGQQSIGPYTSSRQSSALLRFLARCYPQASFARVAVGQ